MTFRNLAPRRYEVFLTTTNLYFTFQALLQHNQLLPLFTMVDILHDSNHLVLEVARMNREEMNTFSRRDDWRKAYLAVIVIPELKDSS